MHFTPSLIQSLDFKYHGLDTVCAASDEIVFILHPCPKITSGHQNHENLVDIIPSPVATKTLRALCKVIDDEFITHLEELTRPVIQVRVPIFLGQVFVIHGL
jgi:hypothetical protein